jgi:hypothetical protein
MSSLNMDTRSLVLRTGYTARYGPRLGKFWIYTIQSGQSFQRRIRDRKLKRVWQLFRSMKTLSKGLYRIVAPKQK